MTPRATALYLRVSTAQQAGDERFGLAVQQRIAEQYAQAHGLSITATYQDVVTGTRASREQLERLLDEAGRYEVVLVSGVDRLARRTTVAYALLEELLETGLEVHSADMGLVDMNDEASAINFGIRTLFAESDHRKITKRMQAGAQAKVRSGKPFHRIQIFGYRDSEIYEPEAEWVRLMFKMCIEGGSGWDIARFLNDHNVLTSWQNHWSESSVQNVLQNPVYKGQYIYGRGKKKKSAAELITCEVPAIVTPEIWQAAHRAKAKRRSGGKPATGQFAEYNVLRGHIFCGECGYSLIMITCTTKSKLHRYFYYRCNHARLRHLEKYADVCNHRTTYKVEVMAGFVLEQLRGLLTDNAALRQAITHPVPKPLDNKGALAAVDKRLANLKLLALDGALSPVEYKETRAELEASRERLQAPPNLLLPDPDLEAARSALADALALDHLPEIARRLDLRVHVHPGGRVDLTLSAL